MRLEIRKRVSPRPFAESGADLDGLVHSMDGARDRPRIIIRTQQVHDHAESADTEADARARCLIYLRENGLYRL
jgi:hypothetical protein